MEPGCLEEQDGEIGAVQLLADAPSGEIFSPKAALHSARLKYTAPRRQQ